MAAVQERLPFEDLPEIPTASPWCQRWHAGQHSWQHVRDGGFDARHYQVDVIPDQAPGKAFVLTHHYSRSYPAVKVQFGLYEVAGGERRLSGVAAFGVPVSTAVLTKPLPELRPYSESLECSRFVLLDECPGNAESWFLARCFDALLADGVRGVVSFADPVPRRTVSGALVMPGHVGTIYAATNALYTGRATTRTVKLLPDGTVFHARAAQKIRRQEQGHEYAEAQLRAFGAPPPRCAPVRVPARPNPP
ncbi:Mom family adenine methylcarbamoylation protein [Streptomyces mauvecolor]